MSGAAGLQAGAAAQGHGHFQLVAQQADDVGHAHRPGVGQTIYIRLANQHGVRTQCDGLEHVGAPADAAIHQHGHLAAHGLGHGGQGLGGGQGGVEGTASVVGDDHARRAAVQRLAGIVGVKNALEQHRQPGGLHQPAHVGPGGGVAQHAIEGAAVDGDCTR